MKKIQSIVGVLLIAAFMVSGLVLTLDTNTASAATGCDYNGNNCDSTHHHKKKAKKKKKTSQVTVQKKVAEFGVYNNARSISAYRTVSAIKKSNPARFRALQSIFNKYNTVGGRLKVRPTVQTVSAINLFRSYDGYSRYLSYVGKLKK
jgi:hypothetical protein